MDFQGLDRAFPASICPPPLSYCLASLLQRHGYAHHLAKKCDLQGLARLDLMVEVDYLKVDDRDNTPLYYAYHVGIGPGRSELIEWLESKADYPAEVKERARRNSLIVPSGVEAREAELTPTGSAMANMFDDGGGDF